MKWIEYDYVCNEKLGITLHKKVEHNAANIAIAEQEACDGRYTITEDDEVVSELPLAISLGGTGASAASQALVNLGALPKAGGTMTGGVDMSGNQITGLGTPSSPGDAATKDYVDSKRLFAKAALATSNWSSTAPYKQTVYLDGISESDTPHYGVVYPGGLKANMAMKEAFAKIDDMDAYDGYMVFTCFEEKPEVDIVVQIEVHRSGGDGGNVGQATALKLTRGLNSDVQAEIEEINYGAENATLNSEPTATTFDFTVL